MASEQENINTQVTEELNKLKVELRDIKFRYGDLAIVKERQQEVILQLQTKLQSTLSELEKAREALESKSKKS